MLKQNSNPPERMWSAASAVMQWCGADQQVWRSCVAKEGGRERGGNKSEGNSYLDTKTPFPS